MRAVAWPTMASVDTYYRDHWVHIEPERVERYKQTFRITDGNRALWLNALGAMEGETIVDFGCGPGAVAVEMAKIVGPGGHVHGIDLNQDLLAAGAELAVAEGVADRVTFHHVTDARIPLPEGSVERVVCKSVLLYVPDIDATMRDAYRVLRPGDRAVTQDSDVCMSACTPFDRHEWRTFVEAVEGAFKDPAMGRNLRGALRRAGFREVDDRGFFRGTFENFLGYAEQLGTMTRASRPGRRGRRVAARHAVLPE